MSLAQIDMFYFILVKLQLWYVAVLQPALLQALMSSLLSSILPLRISRLLHSMVYLQNSSVKCSIWRVFPPSCRSYDVSKASFMKAQMNCGLPSFSEVDLLTAIGELSEKIRCSETCEMPLIQFVVVFFSLQTNIEFTEPNLQVVDRCTGITGNDLFTLGNTDRQQFFRWMMLNLSLSFHRLLGYYIGCLYNCLL